MAEYLINKGVDKPIECCGLKSQYIFLVCGGMVIMFLIASVLLAINITVWFVLPFIGICIYALIHGSTWMNTHLGENGLTKLRARGMRYCFFSNRKTVTHIIQGNKK